MKQLLVESFALKEASDRGEINMIHKPREFMHADIGTKNLALPEFRFHRHAIRDGNFA
jgi:hypothetical protein